MIAVVYSGSRYANWKLSEDGSIVSQFNTVGINPFFIDEKHIISILNKNNQLINHAEKIKRIYFFGAGASSKHRKEIVENAFRSYFKNGKVVVDHDLKAAAIATCKDDQGIVGILGSGSNAAYFNGKRIKENNFGLGFILADEGSSNGMGRQLLKDFLTGTLPEQIEQKLVQRYNIDKKLVLEKVYRQPHPVWFLTSFTDFILSNLHERYVKTLIIEGFQQFFNLYILPLMYQYPGINVHIVGTVAANFENLLRQTAEKNNIFITSIIKEPIYNVLNYYSNKN